MEKESGRKRKKRFLTQMSVHICSVFGSRELLNMLMMTREYTPLVLLLSSSPAAFTVHDETLNL